MRSVTRSRGSPSCSLVCTRSVPARCDMARAMAVVVTVSALVAVAVVMALCAGETHDLALTTAAEAISSAGEALSPTRRSLTTAALPETSGMTSAAGLRAIYSMAGRPRSVAVVGSSGNLLHRGYGAEIDRHDLVIRVNGATTAGYERDVGVARNHFVLGWSKGLEDAMKRHQFDGGAVALVTNPTRNRGRLPSVATGVRAAYLEADWMGKQHTALRSWGFAGSWPSTGWFAVTFGLALGRHFGANVSVYGFGACVKCNKYNDCDGSNSSDKGARTSELQSRTQRTDRSASSAQCTTEIAALRVLQVSCTDGTGTIRLAPSASQGAIGRREVSSSCASLPATASPTRPRRPSTRPTPRRRPCRRSRPSRRRRRRCRLCRPSTTTAATRRRRAATTRSTRTAPMPRAVLSPPTASSWRGTTAATRRPTSRGAAMRWARSRPTRSPTPARASTAHARRRSSCTSPPAAASRARARRTRRALRRRRPSRHRSQNTRRATLGRTLRPRHPCRRRRRRHRRHRRCPPCPSIPRRHLRRQCRHHRRCRRCTRSRRQTARASRTPPPRRQP